MITQEKINEFKYEGLKLEMFWSGRTKAGKCQMEYRLELDGKILTEGTDFLLSPLHYPDSIDAVVSLLGFLTVQKGDTDDEYFKDYSPEFLAFTQSVDCEMLRSYLFDYEDNDKNNEFLNKDARRFFKKHCLINQF